MTVRSNQMTQSNYIQYLPYLSLAIGLIAIAFSILYVSKKSKLKQTGICVDGIIFKQDTEDYSQSDISAENKITVRFVTQKKDWITGDIGQDFQFFYSGQYKDGESVIIYYDEHNPSNFYVDTKQSEIIGRMFIAIIGLVFLSVGLFKLLY